MGYAIIIKMGKIRDSNSDLSSPQDVILPIKLILPFIVVYIKYIVSYNI